MNVAEAARILGVRGDAPWDEVRLAYRTQLRTHHPDLAGPSGAGPTSRITEAYRVLTVARQGAPAAATAPPAEAPPTDPVGSPGWLTRVGTDTLLVAEPGDRAFRLLLEAAHDIGEITYVDRSMPIMEVLCHFEGEPATSMVVTVQGRGTGTEAFCTVESIEARPAPPTASVVDLLELAMRRRGPGDDRR